MIHVDLDQSLEGPHPVVDLYWVPDVVVDLSSHNTNPLGVFDGEEVPLSDVADTRIAESVAALRTFVAEYGSLPTAEELDGGRNAAV